MSDSETSAVDANEIGIVTSLFYFKVSFLCFYRYVVQLSHDEDQFLYSLRG